MAALHEALKDLSPVEWSDVPLDSLNQYVADIFSSSEILCNSVPQPAEGTPFDAAEPHHKEPNLAKSAKDMHPSVARQFASHKDHEELQKSWGKAIKINQKDNPLNVSLYKMAAHDRRGAWFARRSVHEGLGFSKWKKALQREFPHSMAVEGGPGAGAVRGLAVDKRLERKGLGEQGNLEVFQLSAQFPGPVTPRDFVAMVMTSDDALSEKSAKTFENGSTHIPRHYMVVSRPCLHPDTGERPGYVRGQYESVEMIREIPLHRSKMSKSTPELGTTEHHGRDRGSTIAFSESRRPDAKGEKIDLRGTGLGNADPELNPVEWIMITRSDPGGGLPRFLVERGTPDAMLGDLLKFFNWACAFDEVPNPDDDVDEQTRASNGVTTDGAQDPTPSTSIRRSHTMPGASADDAAGHTGILSTLASTITAGLEAYVPAGVSEHVNHYLHPNQTKESISETSSEISDSDSFLSAEELRRLSVVSSEQKPGDSSANLSTMSHDANGHPLTAHEKEIRKLAQEREKLDRKLAKKREEEEEKLKKFNEKEHTEQERAKERRDKELKKTEERHQKALEKLQRKEDKERKKAEERRRKKDDANKLNLVSRERDEFRSQVDLIRRENDLLIKQVEQLQRENTLLASKLGKAAGEDALKGVRVELAEAGPRPSSVRSASSKKSGESQHK